MQKSLAELSGGITILPSEAAAGFSLSPLMPDRKPRGSSRRSSPPVRTARKAVRPRRPAEPADAVAETFYRDLVWTLRNGVVAIRRDGRIAVMNDVAYRILGLTRKASDIGSAFTAVLRDRPDVCRIIRSEERRVGKECGARCAQWHERRTIE